MRHGEFDEPNNQGEDARSPFKAPTNQKMETESRPMRD